LNKEVSTVDEYLALLPLDEKNELQRIRSIILSTLPNIKERIAYKICVFYLNKDLVGFAAYKKYLSLYTISPKLVEKMKDDLQNLTVTGATIHFTVDNPLTESLIRKLIKERKKEITQKIN
jgi:uncharacterized protein YdhG (YjbR/CyaY superfamily)